MAFELRPLNATDIAPMATIISKIGLDEMLSQEDLQNIAKQAKASGADAEDMRTIAGLGAGLKIANKILSHISEVENDVFKFLASMSGKSVGEIKAVPPAEIAEMIIALATQEEFKSFFSVVLKFLQ